MKIFGSALKKPFLKKHASLELSVNAIVVLILAIAMLGLGLGFTKVMFSKLKGAITIPEPKNPATEDEPLVFNRETVTLKPGEPAGFAVNVYNDRSSVREAVVISLAGCTGDNSDFSTLDSVVSAAQNIPARSSVTFKLYMTKETTQAVDPNGAGGGGVCTVTATEGSNSDPFASNQLAFEIQGTGAASN